MVVQQLITKCARDSEVRIRFQIVQRLSKIEQPESTGPIQNCKCTDCRKTSLLRRLLPCPVVDEQVGCIHFERQCNGFDFSWIESANWLNFGRNLQSHPVWPRSEPLAHHDGCLGVRKFRCDRRCDEHVSEDLWYDANRIDKDQVSQR